MVRGVDTQTIGPPKENFSGTVERGIIHDEYVKYEMKVEERDKNKEEVSIVKKTFTKATSREIEEKAEEAINRKMLLSAKILERMISQNIYSEIAFDFKYWEDRSDDFKDSEGTLYPLWTFSQQERLTLDVTCLCWSLKYQERKNIN